ncbi:MAG: bifunctional 2-polyprenyl-6-hydroxyphenol methylase/3-demethylubiquinol 3-O-methyltransferase UbiG [Pacificimonas sp.]
MTNAARTDSNQAAHFSAMADEWWDRSGSSSMLHRVNIIRLEYIRERVATRFGRQIRGVNWLEGLSCLDVGCGGGILAECLARLGGETTAIDTAEASIEVAKAHAAAQSLAIDYRLTTVADLASTKGKYDLVTCMEVVEHVDDVPAFLGDLAKLVKPDGVLIFSTPNRTAMSYGTMILGAEWLLGLLPRGTHDWDSFLTPDELSAMMTRAGLSVTETRGIALNPARGFVLSADKRVNYIGTAIPC